MLLAFFLAAIPAVVPLPRAVSTPITGSYDLPKRLTIRAQSPGERNVGAFLQTFLHQRGIQGRIAGAGSRPQIILTASPRGIANAPEAYDLHVGPEGIVIRASDGAGLFYGLQTLEQLVGPDGAVAFIDISDAPALKWRGIHLDVSRHFFPVPVVEKYIDVAAHYKLNTFHWHLTDDQGWRIEIKRYPRLTQIGSCRAGTEMNGDATTIDAKRYCGYYTQQQIRQVVAYAAKRYVTVVPEIEMPGHSSAALAAYPQLACTPGPFQVRETWGVSTDIYCPSDRTFAFLENVLSEVLALFPSKYVHTGGDEVPKNEWQRSALVHALMKREHLKTYDAVQGYFDRRIERFLQSKGRRMVGWDEILDGGVSTTATVMSWRGEAGGIRAARRGNDVITSPDGPLYFDAYQGDPNDEPQAIGNLSTPQMVYGYDPVPRSLTPAQAKHIIGVQGNLWTEYIGTTGYLFYMLLPRELALSEIAWAPGAGKDWNSFVTRSGAQYAWLSQNGYNFRIPNPEFSIDAPHLQFANVSRSIRTVQAYSDGPEATVAIGAAVPGATIHYTTDGSKPTAKSATYSSPLHFKLLAGTPIDIIAVTVLAGARTSTPSELFLDRP